MKTIVPIAAVAAGALLLAACGDADMASDDNYYDTPAPPADTYVPPTYSDPAPPVTEPLYPETVPPSDEFAPDPVAPESLTPDMPETETPADDAIIPPPVE